MNEAATINNLIQVLAEAEGFAKAIKDEYAANGMDSLANIDYGACLSASLREATAWFRKLDELGMFTMGEE